MTPEKHRDLLFSKPRLLYAEFERRLADATSEAVQLRTPGVSSHEKEVRQVLDAAMEVTGATTIQLIDAYLSIDFGDWASDADIAAEARSQLLPRLRTHLEGWGWRKKAPASMQSQFTLTPPAWSRSFEPCWPDVEAFFKSVEDRARTRRHDRNSQHTYLDRLVRKAKDQPTLAKVVLVALVLSSALGIATAVGTVVGWFNEKSAAAGKAP